MRIILNGEPRDVRATRLVDLMDELGFGGARGRDGRERVVRRRPRQGRYLAFRRRPAGSRRTDAGRLSDAGLLRHGTGQRVDAGNRRVSVARNPGRGVSRGEARRRHRVAAPRIRRRCRAGFLGADPRTGPAGAAEHRRVPHGQGGGHHGAHGARGVRHALDQAGSDRTHRQPATGRLRAGRGGEGIVGGRVPGCFRTRRTT